MPYTHTTYGALKTLLASRLGDTPKVFWIDTAFASSELGHYLAEAFRTFQAFTSYFRGSALATLDTGIYFYDLPTKFPSLLGYTIRDRELIGSLQYHLYEPYSPGAWIGSEQFVLADLVDGLTRARNRFFDDTGLIHTRKAVFTVVSGSGLVDLSTQFANDRVVDIVRAQWITRSGKYVNVWKSDEQHAESSRSGWSLRSGVPSQFSISGTPELQLQLIPPPEDNGILELTIVESGAAFDPTANSNVGTLLDIPDNFAWVLKWGVMMDLMTGTPQEDLCRKMYKMGIEAVMNYRVVLAAELNGRPVKPATLFDFDSGSQGWQGKSVGTPTDLAIASHNLIAVKPAPSSSIASIRLTVAMNAPIPTADSAHIQIGRELIEPLLDYAQFLALFKLGGVEAADGQPYMQRFLESCTGYNTKLVATIRAAEGVSQLQREDDDRPRRFKPRAPRTRE